VQRGAIALSKKIPDLDVVPGGVTAANLFFEVARQISAGNFNGESERIAGDALLSLFAGTSLTLNIIARLNPTGLAYDPAKTYTLYDYLDVAYQGKHYAYIGEAPSAGNAPPDPLHWLLISSDGTGGGIAWTEYTASATLVANTGAIVNSTNDLEFALPSTGLNLGDRIPIAGEGTGIWSVISATGINASNGNTNMGLRRLLSHRFVVADLLWNGHRWIVANPVDMTGLELFDPNEGGES
jgi:hypothetical protein